MSSLTCVDLSQEYGLNMKRAETSGYAMIWERPSSPFSSIKASPRSNGVFTTSSRPLNARWSMQHRPPLTFEDCELMQSITTGDWSKDPIVSGVGTVGLYQGLTVTSRFERCPREGVSSQRSSSVLSENLCSKFSGERTSFLSQTSPTLSSLTFGQCELMATLDNEN